MRRKLKVARISSRNFDSNLKLCLLLRHLDLSLLELALCKQTTSRGFCIADYRASRDNTFPRTCGSVAILCLKLADLVQEPKGVADNL